MIKFNQNTIDLIGNEIFGKVDKETFDYTVFEFKDFKYHNGLSIIHGQIYRMSDEQYYVNITICINGFFIDPEMDEWISSITPLYHSELSSGIIRVFKGFQL